MDIRKYHSICEELDKKAIPHTRPKLYEDQDLSTLQSRPTESPDSVEWRNNNYRQYTLSIFNKFITTTSHFLTAIPRPENMSEPLKELFNKDVFKIHNEYTSEKNFKTHIYRQALENPNYILAAIPYIEAHGPYINPKKTGYTGLLNAHPIMIHYKDLLSIDHEGYSFHYATKKLDNGEKEKIILKCDRTYWYQVISKKKENGEVVHDAIEWYKHDTGEHLLNFLPSIMAKSWDGDYYFRTSLISHFFEIAEEAKSQFSDEKAVRTRASFPVEVVIPQDCPEKNCINGYIKGKKEHKCPRCEDGKTYTISPLGQFIQNKNDSGFLNENKNKGTHHIDPIRWLGPDLQYPNSAYKIAWDLFDKCEHALYMDVLHNSGANESGEALRERKEALLNTIHDIAHRFYEVWDKFMYHCEIIVNRQLKSMPNKNNRPRHILPQQFKLKTEKDAFDDVTNSLPENLLFSKIEYYNNKYKDDPVHAKANKIMVCHTPLFAVDNNMFNTMVAKGVVNHTDILRMMYLPVVMKEISMREDFLYKDDAQIIKQLDDILEKRYNLKKKDITKIQLMSDIYNAE